MQLQMGAPMESSKTPTTQPTQIVNIPLVSNQDLGLSNEIQNSNRGIFHSLKTSQVN